MDTRDMLWETIDKRQVRGIYLTLTYLISSVWLERRALVIP